MSQRNSGYARIDRDLYETPEWVTEALLPHLGEFESAWEPACGSGKMARVLQAANPRADIVLSDIETRLLGAQIRDFMSFGLDIHEFSVDLIATNPPYELAAEFCEQALRLQERERGRVAMLLRTDFDHAKSRTHLFRDCPAFAKKVVLMRRICWFVEANGKPKASPSFNHAWYIWDWRHEGPPTIAYGP